MSRDRTNLKILNSDMAKPKTESVNQNKQSSGLTISGAIDKWLSYCRAEGLSDKSISNYRTFISKFEWWYLEYAKLPDDPNQMTTDNAIDFVAYLKTTQLTERWGLPIVLGKEKLTVSSVATYARTARVLFNWLEERKMIEQNPFNRSVKLRSKKDKLIPRHHKTLEEDQLKAVFEYLTKPDRLKLYNGARDLAMITLLLESGMRRGEMISMRIGDIDWPRKRITIRGKTGERTCFFSNYAEEALLLYQDNFRKKQKDLLSPTSPYWLSSYGSAIKPETLNKMVESIGRACGFTFGPHRLRHTFATRMVNKVGIYELKELLGHTNIATTLIYAHGMPDSLQSSYRGNSPLSDMDVGQLKVKSRRGRPKGSRNIKDDED